MTYIASENKTFMIYHSKLVVVLLTRDINIEKRAFSTVRMRSSWNTFVSEVSVRIVTRVVN